MAEHYPLQDLKCITLPDRAEKRNDIQITLNEQFGIKTVTLTNIGLRLP